MNEGWQEGKEEHTTKIWGVGLLFIALFFLVFGVMISISEKPLKSNRIYIVKPLSSNN